MDAPHVPGALEGLAVHPCKLSSGRQLNDGTTGQHAGERAGVNRFRGAPTMPLPCRLPLRTSPS